jgi:hypothetical protein
MVRRNAAAPFGAFPSPVFHPASSIRAAVRRGRLVHVVGRSAFADLRRALCAWSAAEAALDEERAEAADFQKKQMQSVPLRRCDECALIRGREFLRALEACPRWGMVRDGVESRCDAFVAQNETR